MCDKSGSSVCNHLDGSDMGGPVGPPIPGGAQQAEMQRLRRTRTQKGYSLILSNISAEDIKRNLMNTFNPLQTYDMWQYLVAMYDTPMDASRTDDYITQIRRLTIAEHIGFDADSIQRFGSKIIALNSKLNAADRLDDTAIGNRILIAIMDASHLLHIPAADELNRTSSAQPGDNWKYEVPAVNANGLPNPNGGQRDVRALLQAFHIQWGGFVRSGAIQKRGPSASGAARIANTNAGNTTATAMHVTFEADGNHKLDVDGAIYAQVTDALNITSTEIICDNCRGAGHKRVQCPSATRVRSFQYVTSLLESARARADSRGPSGGARPPPRGQRPPFRAFRPGANAAAGRRPPAQPTRYGSARVAVEGEDDEYEQVECAEEEEKDGNELPEEETGHESARIIAEMPVAIADDDYFQDELLSASAEFSTTSGFTPEPKRIIPAAIAGLLACFTFVLTQLANIVEARRARVLLHPRQHCRRSRVRTTHLRQEQQP